jgi:type IV secretion system protein VirB4
VQDQEVREALDYYTLAGPMGSMLDRDADMLQGGRFLTFETENLLHLDARGVIPVLLYLFRCIERRLDGSPTLIPLDEVWAYLRHDLFREKLRDWLKTMRRKNATVIMATQQISDLSNSDISDVLFENCPTKILLPNSEAKTAGSRLFYERVGLNDRELGQLAGAIPKQHYYVVSSLGRRMVDLGIGPVSLAFVGVNGREERQQVATVMEDYPDTWQAEWLRSKGQFDWAAYYERMEGTPKCVTLSAA